MTERGMENAGREERRRARRGTIGKLLIAVLVFLLIQSVTITLPIRARVVDAKSGKPVERARVVALWSLKMMTPHSYDPGGEVRISYVKTDAKGEFKLPLTFIVHPPVAPFSLLLRSDELMPWLVVVTDGYRIAGAISKYRDPGFLSLRHSSIHRSTIELTPLPLDASDRNVEQEELSLSAAEDDISRARSSCRHRMTCIGESVDDVLHAIQLRQEMIRKEKREQSREQGKFRTEHQGGR